MADAVSLTCTEDGASKFWSGSVKGKTLATRWGKIGTAGQAKEETFASAAEAKASLQKQAAAKRQKGYVDAALPPSPLAASTPAAVKAASPKKGGPTLKPAKAKRAPAPSAARAATAFVVATASKSALSTWLRDPTRSGDELASAVGRFPETDRLIAAHNNTGADVLSTLSHSKDRSTRAKVAANAVTPLEDFLRLGQQFPDEFMGNLQLDILLLENPALLQSLPEALLLRVLKRESCPEGFLTFAAGMASEKIQLGVAMNPKAPAAAIALLRKSTHAAVRASLPEKFAKLGTKDPEEEFREEVRKRLAKLTLDEVKEAWGKGHIGLPQFPQLRLEVKLHLAEWDLTRGILKPLAQNPNMPAALLDALAQYADSGVRAAVAHNRSTSVPLLEIMAKDADRYVRSSVAKNPSTPVALLPALSKDEEGWVRSSVAQNPNTPVALLEALAKDMDRSVRGSVAENPNTPVVLLAALGKDKYLRVLSSVAENPNTPVALLEALLAALAKDGDKYDRSSVAKNPNTPVAVLETLAKDKDKDVRRSVAENPNTPVAVLKALTKVSSARDSVAGNPNTPVALLNALAKDKKWTIRRSVAKKPNTPAALLEALAKDEDSSVRSSVAENPSTPVALLEALAKDKEWYVRSSVAKNPNTPVALLEPLAKDKDKDAYVRSSVAENSNTPVALLKALAKDKGWDVRLYVARNPNTSVAVLEALAKDESVYESRFVRCSVAGNPSTPVASLAALAKDNDYDVRVSVAENPNSPAALLEALAKDEYYTVRIAVASNPNTPETAMMQLASDCMTDRRHSTYPVRERLASNPAATPAVLEKMYADIVGFARLLEDEPLRVPAIAEQRARSDENIRSALDTGNFLFTPNKDPNGAVLSRNPIAVLMALCSGAFVEPARIARISGSTDWLVRAAVARNPGTPPNLVKKLGADAHPLVRALVSARSKPPNIDGAVPGTHA